ncbi:hypothetical protein SAMN05192561_11272 [Halopenitus malekzadehii]|uniref:Phage late control gene D protein (GPD) n=1 Tax=Halopenitus malekzadehii TaxID=1267564 RepID=A0A1H6JJV2_9EURY|nr:hypothetical protein [Halopenitus malekzadehii]SEH61116.1 hypothetical protein SAMN05192561_11272 [Halopenitus malekzadehii]
MPWRQHRHVEAGEVSLDGLDLDVSVTKPKDDPLEFTVKTWNLTSETWSQIETEDLCRIELGWEDGDVETVMIGKIDTRKRAPDGRDVSYEIGGIDETEAVTKSRPDRSWSQKAWLDKRPDQIVESIAGEIGLSAQTGSAGSPIQGSWSVTPDKAVAQWLDELLQIAAEKTGVEWEWFASGGQIHFTPRSQGTVEAPKLSQGGMLISLGEKSDTSDDTEGQLNFESMLEPRIAKGATVYVETDDYQGPYRVSDYEFQSSTVSGDHLVSGTLTPVEADYSIES